MPISDYDRQHIGGILAGEGDWFTAQLLRLIVKADVENRGKLRAVFPDEVAAVEEWQGPPWPLPVAEQISRPD